MVRNPEGRLSHVEAYMRGGGGGGNNRVHGSRFLRSCLSILIHSVISLQDATSWDKNQYILLLKKVGVMLLIGFVRKKNDFKVVLWSYD